MSLGLLLLNLCQVNYEIDEHVDETETDAQMQRRDSWLPRRRGLGEERSRRLGSADAN